MFFYVHQLHRDDSTQPRLFMSWVALCEPLVCSYEISHSRAWQASITSLAATSVAQMVTHPSTNWAQSCLTKITEVQNILLTFVNIILYIIYLGYIHVVYLDTLYNHQGDSVGAIWASASWCL